MKAQTYRSPARVDRSNKAYLWWAEQKVATLLAVTAGSFIGLGYGLALALKSLFPHFTSVDGFKRLYHGDPAARLGSQSRAYVKDSFADGRLKPSGYSSTVSSAPLTTGTSPALANGSYSSGSTGYTAPTTGQTSDSTGKEGLYQDPYASSKPAYSSDTTAPLNGTHTPTSALNGTATTTPTLNGKDSYPSSSSNDVATKQQAYNADTTDVYPKEPAYSHDTTAPKTGTTTPGGITSPEDSESETDDEAGSEYTATSSTPTTPRGGTTSVLAPADGNSPVKEKKKRRKKMAKGIKKTFSKITDALTPGTSSTKA